MTERTNVPVLKTGVGLPTVGSNPTPSAKPRLYPSWLFDAPARNTVAMGKTFDGIDESLAAWMSAQPVFFVATAPLGADGLVNCSPKGNRGEFVVLSPTSVAYLDQTGSGVESIAHLKENGRIVVMFCAFEGPPRIVRLHGTGRAVPATSSEFASFASSFGGGPGVGARSVVVVDVARVADSCGYGVPFMDFVGHRPTMDQWSTRKGPEGIAAYWAEKNLRSLDGLPGLDVAADAPSAPDVH